MTTVLLTVVIVAACFGLLWLATRIWKLNQVRRRGDYPVRPTLFDVKRFLEAGEKEAAVRVYGQIFMVSRAEAAAAVDEMERGLRI